MKVPPTCTCMQVLFGLIRHTCRKIVWWAEMFSAWEASLLLWVVVFVIDQLLSVQETQWDNKWESKQVQGVQMVYVMSWDRQTDRQTENKQSKQSKQLSVSHSLSQSAGQSVSQSIHLSVCLSVFQLSWQCKLASVKRFESWCFER